jgi:hypothetical protein
VEPTPKLSREERIAPVRDAFARDASPVTRAILAAGGEVLGEAWINQTIRARVPPEGIPALSARSGLGACSSRGCAAPPVRGPKSPTSAPPGGWRWWVVPHRTTGEGEMKAPGRRPDHHPAPAKITPALAERVDGAALGEVLDVIVELQPRQVEPVAGETHEERTAPVRQGFERDALPVEEAIRMAGGTVVGRAWINQTLRASVPLEALAGLAGLDEVVALDVPRALRPE